MTISPEINIKKGDVLVVSTGVEVKSRDMLAVVFVALACCNDLTYAFVEIPSFLSHFRHKSPEGCWRRRRVSVVTEALAEETGSC